MEGGLVSQPVKGTPQGGPLAQLLSNIILDDLDTELDRRDHSYSRYADECNVYVASKRSGNRVMESVRRFVERRLRLKLNKEKSAVDQP
jgi:retron-type reverse transcriptase